MFLAFSLIITIFGIVLLWYAFSSDDKVLCFPINGYVGLIFVDLGGFNTVEGIVNHHVLEVYHVMDVAEPFAFDLAFLIVGGLAFLVTGGILLITKGLTKFWDMLTNKHNVRISNYDAKMTWHCT